MNFNGYFSITEEAVDTGNNINDVKCKSYGPKYFIANLGNAMRCSQEARRCKLISFTVLSYLHSSFFVYLFAMHCTMLSPHVMPLYSVYGLKYIWQLRSSSVTTAFTQKKYPLTLVTCAFRVRSLCFMSRCMTELIAYYAYIWNGMKGN